MQRPTSTPRRTVLIAVFLSYVIDPPKIMTHPSNSSVELGGDVTLACNASGDPQPTFKWYKDSISMVETDDINPFLPKLVLKGALAQDDAWYSCEATNVAGTVRSNSASLKVFGEQRNEMHICYCIVSCQVRLSNASFVDEFWVRMKTRLIQTAPTSRDQILNSVCLQTKNKSHLFLCGCMQS